MKQCTTCGSVVSGDVCPACGTPLAPAQVPPPYQPTDANAGVGQGGPPLASDDSVLEVRPAASPAASKKPQGTPTAQTLGAARCPQGHSVAEGAKFCGECGSPTAVEPIGQAPGVPPPLGGSPPLAMGGLDPLRGPSADEPRKSRRRWPMVLGAFAVLAVGAAAGWALLLRPSTQDQYLEALDEAGVRSEFQTDRAATLRAESVCEEFDSSGEPRGGVIEHAAAEHYCPEWMDGFQLLETTTITGTFAVLDSDEYRYADDGDFCEGEGGYGDINSSTQVVLSNSTGDIITRSNLGPGLIDSRMCVYSFELEVTEGEDSYVLAVGDRGESTYSFDDLKSGVDLSLG